MKKYLLLFLTGSLILSGCGEAGFESDISKNIEIDPISLTLSVPDALVGQVVGQTPATSVSTGTIDITGDDFEDFLSDAELFTLNQLSYTVENFPANSSANLDVDVSLAIAGGSFQPLLTATINGVQNNPNDIVLYSSESPGNANANTIAQFEQALLNGQSFEMQIEVVGRDVTLQTTDVDFDLIFKFDVTARIQLN